MMLSINEYGELIDNSLMLYAVGPVIPPQPDQGGRSGKWPAFVKGFLNEHPACCGCGRKATTGHHLKPFHLFPELELAESNIAPVCLPCHFVLGHGGDWKLYMRDAKASLARNLAAVQKAIRPFTEV